jgi:hypothetical protein
MRPFVSPGCLGKYLARTVDYILSVSCSEELVVAIEPLSQVRGNHTWFRGISDA